MCSDEDREMKDWDRRLWWFTSTRVLCLSVGSSTRLYAPGKYGGKEDLRLGVGRSRGRETTCCYPLRQSIFLFGVLNESRLYHHY